VWLICASGYFVVFVYFCPRLFLFCSKREQMRESSCARLYCSVVSACCVCDVCGMLIFQWFYSVSVLV